MGPAEPARVRELKAYHQVLCGAEVLGMRRLENPDQFLQAPFILLADDQLIGVGASVRSHRHRFGTADDLRPTLAKSPPASSHLLRHPARRRAVPAFHGMDDD